MEDRSEICYRSKKIEMASVHVPRSIRIPNIWCQFLWINIDLCLNEPIAQEIPHILCIILEIVVLPSNSFHGFQEMEALRVSACFSLAMEDGEVGTDPPQTQTFPSATLFLYQLCYISERRACDFVARSRRLTSCICRCRCFPRDTCLESMSENETCLTRSGMSWSYQCGR